MPRPPYHHAIGLDHLGRIDGVLVPDPALSDPDFLPAYRWAEREVGFFPLFLSVGTTADDMRMTGYQNNWQPPDRLGTHDPDPADRRLVLFSFDSVAGVFSDYSAWHIVLNSSHCDYRVGRRYTSWILRRSWPTSRWLREARRCPHSVQLLAPRLDLREAVRVWTPDDESRRQVERLGYAGVRVKRVAYEGRSSA